MRGSHLPVIPLCLVFSLLAPVSSGVEFAGGTGEPDDPYQIATTEQLLAMHENWNLRSKHFVLVADIDLDPTLPGGRVFSNPVFSLTTGSLNGCGHKLLNLRIVPQIGRATWASNLGPNAIIRSVLFERVVVEGDSPILALASEGYIADCSVEGVSCGMGLVAENRGTIVGCSVTVDAGGTCGLAGKNSGSILFSHVSGGLATDGGLVRENSGTISDCYSTADVLGSRTGGGLVGTNSGTISRCYATGKVSVLASPEARDSSAGGLVGGNSGVISDCYARGTATAAGTHPYYTYAGGLVGANTGMVLRCYAVGAGGGGLTANVYSSLGLAANSYFLSPSDGGGSVNGPGIPLTDLQMRRRESFLGWDFRGSSLDGTSETWDMPEDGGYPILAAVQRPMLRGSGTAEEPYLIESADQLLAIRRDIWAHYRLMADIDLQDQSFSRSIIPDFRGHLDGNGHGIFNFTFTGEDDPGFFGVLHVGTTVAKLHLYSIHVVAPKDDLPRLAGVLAVHNSGRIVACSVSADTAMWGVSSGSVPAEYVGGLVAVNEEGGEISRCFVSWVAAGSSNRGGMACWGGIAGHNAGSIVECHVSALVSGYVSKCASLVGRNDGVAMNCHADGYCLVAGLIYSNHGQIADCYAAVMVPPGWNGGGLVAENPGGTITNSYFLTQADGGGPDNGLGLSLLDAQMRQQASFSGWDFDEVWMICEGRDYPRLRWEDIACEP